MCFCRRISKPSSESFESTREAFKQLLYRMVDYGVIDCTKQWSDVLPRVIKEASFNRMVDAYIDAVVIRQNGGYPIESPPCVFSEVIEELIEDLHIRQAAVRVGPLGIDCGVSMATSFNLSKFD
jgi:hypothetical protein